GAGVLLTLPLVMLLPLGRMTAGSQEWRTLRTAAATDSTRPWTLLGAARTGAFWGLFVAYFFTAVAAYSVMPHLVAYLVERGFSPLVAASAFGFAGMLSAFGTIGVGWLSDRFGRRQTATLSYVSTIIGVDALYLVELFPA